MSNFTEFHATSAIGRLLRRSLLLLPLLTAAFVGLAPPSATANPEIARRPPAQNNRVHQQRPRIQQQRPRSLQMGPRRHLDALGAHLANKRNRANQDEALDPDTLLAQDSTKDGDAANTGKAGKGDDKTTTTKATNDGGDEDDGDLGSFFEDMDPEQTALNDRRTELSTQIRDMRAQVATLTQAFLKSEWGEPARDRIGRERDLRDQQLQAVRADYAEKLALVAAAEQAAAELCKGAMGVAEVDIYKAFLELGKAVEEWNDNATNDIYDDYKSAVDSILEFEINNSPDQSETLDKYNEAKKKLRALKQEQNDVTTELNKMIGTVPGK